MMIIMKQRKALKGLRSFWSKFGKAAATPAVPAGEAKLLDMDGQLKIDQYRGRIEDFLLEFDKYEEYLDDTPAGSGEWLSKIKSPELIKGFATVEGTQSFKQRAHSENFSKTLHLF